jgi:acylphosphatase
VRNEADGTVHVVAQGEPVDLDALLDALHEGPMGADVREVRATRGPTTATLTDFDIRAGGHPGD